MKLTLSWLQDHLETGVSLDEIVERLTMIGLEVESVDDKSVLKPFVIARVLTAERHPDADRLKVLTVDRGDGKAIQVVCGAPNARAGLVGAFAAPGTYVPGIDTTLSVGRIRGVESQGMMCSERELLISEDHEGIIDLPSDAPVGQPFAAWAGLDDPVIEINLTPNRPDCTGIHGIARDLAAAGLGTLKRSDIVPVTGSGPCPVSVTIEAPELCPGFALRLVRGVKNGPSPRWLQQRLLAIGLRPINALVDITNFFTFDRGRPLHVFDAAKVSGNLVVRSASEGESILALDGREYELGPGICVIADDKGVESIAGIMGGEHSGCDGDTTDVLIESALWSPVNVARTGRDLGILTDARYRFERGVDPEFMVPGLELATRMVLELCGGEASETEVVGYAGHEGRVIDFPLSEVKRLTGLDVPGHETRRILENLGFGVEDGRETEVFASGPPAGTFGYVARENVRSIRKEGHIAVTVPSWRPDIDGKADLVEEVMRIRGVDSIPFEPLAGRGAVNERILTALQVRNRLARRVLAARGMMEAVTWSFIPAEHATLFGGGSPALRLANPIAAEMSDMRPSLLPGLIAAARRNADRGHTDVALFEVSGVYHGTGPADQRAVAAGIRRGKARFTGSGRHWQDGSGPVDVFEAKADAIAVLEACGAPVASLQIEAGAPGWYHPGRSGTIRLGPKTVLGTFGEFHPDTLARLDVTGALAGFEIFVDAIPEPKRKPTRTRPRLDLSPFQAVTRDFAFVVDRDVGAASILRAVAGADRKLVSDVTVFDVFEGASIGAGKKSVAVEVSIQPVERTLAEEDFEALSNRIIASVAQQTGGVLRK